MKLVLIFASFIAMLGTAFEQKKNKNLERYEECNLKEFLQEVRTDRS